MGGKLKLASVSEAGRVPAATMAATLTQSSGVKDLRLGASLCVRGAQTWNDRGGLLPRATASSSKHLNCLEALRTCAHYDTQDIHASHCTLSCTNIRAVLDAHPTPALPDALQCCRLLPTALLFVTRLMFFSEILSVYST